MSTTGTSTGRLSFGEFTLDPERVELLGPLGEVKLRPKTYQVLCYLVAHPGRLVTKDELFDAVWGQTVVTQDSLTQCVVEIRRALGDDARSMVRTVPRRGYLFEAQVRALEPGAPVPGPPPVTTPEAASGAPIPAPPARTRSVPATGITLLAGAGLVAALGWWGLADRDAERAEPPLALPAEVLPNSIAVLPFKDMSASQDQEHFGDGIAEEILNLLAQAPELKVIARTSSFSFKDRPADIMTIAAQLRAEYVLEGSVRVSGNRVRVAAQLIAARDGAHRWSQSYDRQLGDLLEMQSDIAAAVADVLQATLVATPAHADKQPPDPRAYDAFLRARFLFQRRSPGDLERALAQFEAALAIDPDYAPAWVGLAGALFVLSHEDERFPLEVAMPRRMEAVQRALALDPKLPEAHLRAAHVYAELENWDTAMRHFRIARELDPENTLLLGNLAGMALGRGDLEEAVAFAGRVVTLDPLSRVARSNLASMLEANGQIDDARAQFLVMSELDPGQAAEIDFRLARLLVLEGRHEDALERLRDQPSGRPRDTALAVALYALGREQEAAAVVARLQADVDGETALSLAEVHAQRGDFDTAFHWLATSQAEFVRELPGGVLSWAQLAYVSAFLRPLHDDPRWAALYLGVQYPVID